MDLFDQAWQVPARTIDMLGRQQIANIPTALHELFKNAHDAYAKEVVADFFRADRMLVIRDSGDGMTEKQLKDGWLTLASSSKHGANDDPKPRVDGQPRRAIMGEKGIGRLAIASIGPQVLIMTRPRTDDGSVMPLLVSLIHWGVNQLPDVDLSRIVIPTMRVRGGDLPDDAAVRALADRMAENVRSLRTDENAPAVDAIVAELAGLDLDPADLLENLPGPSLARGGHGTQFIVVPTDEMLASDLERNDDQVSQVEKYLLGFSNTMMPDRPEPAIIASFLDHKEDATKGQPIDRGAFFRPQDFLNADHAIEGYFDPFGQFTGDIRVYGGEPRTHEIPWKGSMGTKSRCGPFRITFAYIQGLLKDTRLDPETWADMSAKLNLMGGLYVYRDGIRILPYGGPDQDFVGIERRRTKSASDWFFSYRRIFGAVEISDLDNRALREKAGREGFIRDGAYKDFVSILSNFFETLAYDFFRESSNNTQWIETKQRLNLEAKLLERREKSAKAKLVKFDRDIDRVFDKLERGRLVQVAAQVKEELVAKLDASATLADPDRASVLIEDIERSIGKKLDDLDTSLKVAKPRGAALNRRRSKDWDAYCATYAKVRVEVLRPLRAEVRRRVSEVVSGRNLPLDRRKRLLDAIDRKGDAAKSVARRLGTKVEEGLSGLRQEVEQALKTAANDLAGSVARAQVDFGRTDVAGVDERDLDVLQGRWEETIETAISETTLRLESLADQMDSLIAAIHRGETLDQTTDAIETRSEALSDELDKYVELAQIGTAVGIVQHEFASAVKGVRGAIKRLGPWADANADLGELERDLRNGFEHLDAYLNLFAPLSRRLTSTRIDVTGSEVRNYLLEVFQERLDRHSVDLQATDDFLRAKLTGQPSAILAAFVNLADNALHWVDSVPAEERRISLDVGDDGMTLSNSGPAIEPRVADRIFDHGETTRLGGRGLGLYVSREALRRSALDLTLETTGADSAPVFRIGPRREADDAGGDA